MTTRTPDFDWYTLSKMNQENPNLQIFADLIKNSDIDKNNVTNIPLHYRKKLLLIFQSSSQIMKQNYQANTKQKQQLLFQKRIISEKIQFKKNQLENSLAAINSLKMEVQNKKKAVNKFKKKIEQHKSKKEETHKQIYYCPFCSRNDFSSRQIFTMHLYRDHESILAQKKHESEQEKINKAELKDLLISLKDKQFALMEMMLSKHKQMQTEQLQRLYQFELRKMESQPNFTQRRSLSSLNQAKKINKNISYSNDQHEQHDEQLKGESQYLFYQQDLKKQKPNQQKQIYTKKDDKNSLRPHYQNNNQYYEIFASSPNINGLSENQSRYSYNSGSSPNLPNQERYIAKKITYPTNNQEIKSSQKNKLSADKNPKQYLTQRQSAQQQKSQTISKIFNPSQKKTNLSANKGYSTVYQMRKNYHKNTHIFNSGPLMDDNSGQSDIQDYFDMHNINQGTDEVQDEQIKLHQDNSNTYSHHGIHYQKSRHKAVKNTPNQQYFERINFSNSKSQSNIMLQYSKDKSSLDIIDKEKSSDFVDLSNSFSKRHMQDSKDDTINLSDLKLSKLEKQKQIEYMSQASNNYKQKQSINNSKVSVSNKDFKKKGSDSKIYTNSQLTSPKPSVLEEFKRSIQQSKFSQANQPEQISYRDHQNQQRQFLKLQKFKSIEANKNNDQGNILNQFIRKR